MQGGHLPPQLRAQQVSILYCCSPGTRAVLALFSNHFNEMHMGKGNGRSLQPFLCWLEVRMVPGSCFCSLLWKGSITQGNAFLKPKIQFCTSFIFSICQGSAEPLCSQSPPN